MYTLIWVSQHIIHIVKMFLSLTAARPCLLWQGKDMLMVLENDTMKLIDPLGQTLLHAQPIGSIRVWGVGRDNGRSVSRLQEIKMKMEDDLNLIYLSNILQLLKIKHSSWKMFDQWPVVFRFSYNIYIYPHIKNLCLSDSLCVCAFVFYCTQLPSAGVLTTLHLKIKIQIAFAGFLFVF